MRSFSVSHLIPYLLRLICSIVLICRSFKPCIFVQEKRICQETDEVGCRTVTKRECRPLPAGTPCVRQTGSAATAGRAAPRQPKEIISSDRQQLTALADSFDSFQPTSSTTARTTPMTTARTTPKTTTAARPTIVASAAPSRRYYARPIYHRRYHYSLSP